MAKHFINIFNNRKKKYRQHSTYYGFIALICSIVVTFLLDKKQTIQNYEIGNDLDEMVTQPFRADYSITTLKSPLPPKPHLKRFPRLPTKFLQKNQEMNRTIIIDKSYFKLPKLSSSIQLKDWYNYALQNEESKRQGLGEHGIAAKIPNNSMQYLEKELFMDNGFNALLSDFISVNRSLPDTRPKSCLKKLYPTNLPNISVIIPCYNEYFSVLCRTLHSIVNRTPAELLKEIIIVDDNSNRLDLQQNLLEYVTKEFGSLVKIIRLKERKGLIIARLKGAQQAVGTVLIFFDSHIECTNNWLPPLLDPIIRNNRVATCPIIDIIDHTTFAYKAAVKNSARGAFDWNMLYKFLPQLKEFDEDEPQPYPSPVMMGGLFAINRENFWELGGYDEDLEIWGGEQYELSFKIWMCNGMIFDVPCSRLAHIFRGPMKPKPNPRNYNFVARNHKRVAEVWMDDYKKFVYLRQPNIYDNLDAGDLSKPRLLRQRLKCKTFQWYLNTIAPDLLLAFPPDLPNYYASGTLQSLAYPHLCLDTLNGHQNSEVGIFVCARNHTYPHRNQYWVLSMHRDIRIAESDLCLDARSEQPNATVFLWQCHYQRGNQFWFYDRYYHWLVHGRNGVNCLEIVSNNNQTIGFRLLNNACDNSNPRMKWNFATTNDELLDSFYNEIF